MSSAERSTPRYTGGKASGYAARRLREGRPLPQLLGHSGRHLAQDLVVGLGGNGVERLDDRDAGFDEDRQLAAEVHQLFALHLRRL